jgi:25S rRNA (adenine2142-N1)-methyltransferase
MRVLPIDLRSQHPDITEQDFLLLNPDHHRSNWDGVSLSLVINFVPDARDRGESLYPEHSL